MLTFFWLPQVQNCESFGIIQVDKCLFCLKGEIVQRRETEETKKSVLSCAGFSSIVTRYYFSGLQK